MPSADVYTDVENLPRTPIRRKRADDTHTTANNESAKMKELMISSANRTMYKSLTKPVSNPIWLEFPTRCVEPVVSEQHMRNLLEYHTNSHDVMYVRYWQEGCTACNALDKVMEAICHSAKRDYPNMRFYDIKKEAHPTLVDGMVRFPQIKAFNGGQWMDIDFKPPQYFRDEQYKKVAEEVRRMNDEGIAVDAVAAEEMYFSASGPAVLTLVQEACVDFYLKSQARMHNYWKQVSVRRTWFFRKYIEPTAPAGTQEASEKMSVFGEIVAKQPGATPTAA